MAVGAVLIIQYAFFDLLGRFDDDALADYRFTISATTIEAAKSFQPVGSGVGTFVPVYQMFETPSGLQAAYVNHAHNDWLEIGLEGGWLAIGIVVAFVIWFGAQASRVWSKSESAHVVDKALAQASSVVIALLLLHSAVDYPLRTTALGVLFGCCCGLLIPPRRVSPARYELEADSLSLRTVQRTRRLKLRMQSVSAWQSRRTPPPQPL
jgi:O-antigen ligase